MRHTLADIERGSTPRRRAACCADAFLWLSSRAFCGPAGAWENVEPRAGTAPPPCVVEASHRFHIVIVHIPARHRRASPHRVRPRLCHVLSRHESIMSPLIFRIRIRHTPDRMSNNKLLNLSLRLSVVVCPYTHNTHAHATCSADPPLQNNYAIHGSQDLKYQLLNKLKAPQSMCFKINN